MPTAELRPEEDGAGAATGGSADAQSDELDMGMSYAELGDLGFCRKVEHCGPLSTYLKLRTKWAHKTEDWKSPADNDRAITPSIRVKVQPTTFEEKVAQKVKDFYFYNAINRHKMTTLTPSYHAENYSPDDNRFDHRQILYPKGWTRQFATMDALIAQDEERTKENNQTLQRQSSQILTNQLSRIKTQEFDSLLDEIEHKEDNK